MGWRIVGGTGHRDFTTADATQWTWEQLPRCMGWLRDRANTEIWISGMGRGFDLRAARAALRAGLQLWAFIPFEEQPARWSREDRREWSALRALAAETRVIGAIPAAIPADRRHRAATRLLFARNTAVLDECHALVAAWEPERTRGGTYGTLRVATRRRMQGIHLNPTDKQVRFHLPTLEPTSHV